MNTYDLWLIQNVFQRRVYLLNLKFRLSTGFPEFPVHSSE